MSEPIDVKFKKMSNATVKVRVIETKEWRIRRAVGMRLILLGFKIMGYRVEVL